MQKETACAYMGSQQTTCATAVAHRVKTINIEHKATA